MVRDRRLSITGGILLELAGATPVEQAEILRYVQIIVEADQIVPGSIEAVLRQMRSEKVKLRRLSGDLRSSAARTSIYPEKARESDV